VQIVDVKPADITQDFFGALVTPMVFCVTDGVAMQAVIASVITKFAQVFFLKIVDPLYVAELGDACVS
jgi:hypothetical protein